MWLIVGVSKRAVAARSPEAYTGMKLQMQICSKDLERGAPRQESGAGSTALQYGMPSGGPAKAPVSMHCPLRPIPETESQSLTGCGPAVETTSLPKWTLLRPISVDPGRKVMHLSAYGSPPVYLAARPTTARSGVTPPLGGVVLMLPPMH